METISNSLFWISNGLLVPVIVLLLLFFLRAIILAGGFFGEFYQRMKLQKQLSEMLETITPENINEQLQSLPQAGKQPLLRCLKKLAEHLRTPACQLRSRRRKRAGTLAHFHQTRPNAGIDGNTDSDGSRPCRTGYRRYFLNGLQYAGSLCHHRGRYGDCRSRRHHSASETTLVCP